MLQQYVLPLAEWPLRPTHLSSISTCYSRRIPPGQKVARIPASPASGPHPRYGKGRRLSVFCLLTIMRAVLCTPTPSEFRRIPCPLAYYVSQAQVRRSSDSSRNLRWRHRKYSCGESWGFQKAAARTGCPASTFRSRAQTARQLRRRHAMRWRFSASITPNCCE